ncbi:MAG: adenylosuccinate synthetase [Paludibacteraceae bacterium]|nr:adenylosuccinate synthetase [Paludibacteraceae bacterium]
MKRHIVIGSLFGDEGKGVAVQWLCKKSLAEGHRPLVVRFTGGPQAAHTVCTELNGTEQTHVFASFGSGTLLGVPTIYRSSSLIDPICMKNEWEVLDAKQSPCPIIDVRRAPIITPYDVEANRNDSQNRSDGTCGKGVYMAWKRTHSGVCFTINDHPETILNHVSAYYGVERYLPYDEMFVEAFDFLREKSVSLEEEAFDDLIFESTQGLLLDAERGFLPHVTATSTGLNALEDADIEESDVYFVVRTYLTRHGNGYEPKTMDGYELDDVENETNVLNEFQGRFKTGVFDFDLLNEAFARHDIASYRNCRIHMAVTHLDVVLQNGAMNYLQNGDLYQLPMSSEASYESIIRLFRKNVSLPITSIVGCDSPKGEFHQF